MLSKKEHTQSSPDVICWCWKALEVPKPEVSPGKRSDPQAMARSAGEVEFFRCESSTRLRRAVHGRIAVDLALGCGAFLLDCFCQSKPMPYVPATGSIFTYLVSLMGETSSVLLPAVCMYTCQRNCRFMYYSCCHKRGCCTCCRCWLYLDSRCCRALHSHGYLLIPFPCHNLLHNSTLLARCFCFFLSLCHVRQLGTYQPTVLRQELRKSSEFFTGVESQVCVCVILICIDRVNRRTNEKTYVS